MKNIHIKDADLTLILKQITFKGKFYFKEVQ